MHRLPCPLHPVRPAPLLLAAALATAAGTAWAVDCEVNPLEAHNIAKLRGWSFSCNAVTGIVHGFVTYPPSAFGCTYKTPPVMLPTVTHLGSGAFFRNTSVSGGRPNLKNGWVLKHYEITGGQWRAWSAHESVRLAFSTQEEGKPNRTYNFRVSKLVLTHPSSTCAKALDEAF